MQSTFQNANCLPIYGKVSAEEPGKNFRVFIIRDKAIIFTLQAIELVLIEIPLSFLQSSRYVALLDGLQASMTFRFVSKNSWMHSSFQSSAGPSK